MLLLSRWGAVLVIGGLLGLGPLSGSSGRAPEVGQVVLMAMLVAVGVLFSVRKYRLVGNHVLRRRLFLGDLAVLLVAVLAMMVLPESLGLVKAAIIAVPAAVYVGRQERALLQATA